MTARVSIKNASRSATFEYQAELWAHGVKVGYVNRGYAQGGMFAKQYRAVADGITVAAARTLSELREDLREWEADETQMESDAVWFRMSQDNTQ